MNAVGKTMLLHVSCRSGAASWGSQQSDDLLTRSRGTRTSSRLCPEDSCPSWRNASSWLHKFSLGLPNRSSMTHCQMNHSQHFLVDHINQASSSSPSCLLLHHLQTNLPWDHVLVMVHPQSFQIRNERRSGGLDRRFGVAWSFSFPSECLADAESDLWMAAFGLDHTLAWGDDLIVAYQNMLAQMMCSCRQSL